ncbi:MAG: 50S ribosomal protein L29 [Elusimicrobiota bacterium]
MAKEKKEINLRELTADELSMHLEETKEKLFHLKFGHKTTPLKNPLEIRHLKRQIARILTIIKGGGKEQGVKG